MILKIIEQIAPWVVLITTALLTGLLSLDVGRIIATRRYRRKLKENKGLMPCRYSLFFSTISAFIVLFLAGWFLFKSGILVRQSLKSSTLTVFVGIPVISLSIIIACEWLLRKMIRHREPNIRFERWMFLK